VLDVRELVQSVPNYVDEALALTVVARFDGLRLVVLRRRPFEQA
jgi:hypothetical protein